MRSNLRSYCAMRIDVAVIDREVMGYLLAEPGLAQPGRQLAFIRHLGWASRSPGCACHGVRLQLHPGCHAGAQPAGPSASYAPVNRVTHSAPKLAEQRWSPDTPYCP